MIVNTSAKKTVKSPARQFQKNNLSGYPIHNEHFVLPPGQIRGIGL